MVRFATGLVLLFVLSSSPPAAAATFTVDSLFDAAIDHDADPGDGICRSRRGATCSLRAAIEESNALAGAHVIRFAIAGVISPTTEGTLPVIERQVLFLGDTAPGYAVGASDIGIAPPRVYLNGSFLPTASSGLLFGPGSSSSLVRAIGVIGFSTCGISVRDGSSDTSIVDSWIGVAANGTASGNDNGICISGARARIGRFVSGGDILGLGNLISGNARGITVNSTATAASIHGNRIGLRPDGAAGLGNTQYGIDVSGGSDHQIGAADDAGRFANLIAASGLEGVYIRGGSRHRLAANRFGRGRFGQDIASAGVAITIVDGVDHAVGPGNQITNHAAGVRIGIGIDTVTRATVIGNEIGSFSGETIIPGDGVEIDDCVDCSVIGNRIISIEGDGIVLRGDGTLVQDNDIGFIDTLLPLARGLGGNGIRVLGDGNILGIAATTPIEPAGDIGPNTVGYCERDGVRIEGENNVLDRAFIGVLANGVPASNSGHGVSLGPFARGNRISRSRIAHNGLDGIASQGNNTAAIGNRFLYNAYGANAGLPIDLGDDGIDENDAGDVDVGVNARINHPDLLTADWYLDEGEPTVRVRFSIDAVVGTVDFPLLVTIHLGDGIAGVLWPNPGIGYGEPGTIQSVDLRLPAGMRGGRLRATSDGFATGTSEFSPPLAFGVVGGLFVDGFE